MDTLRQLLPYIPPGLARAYLYAPAAQRPSPPLRERLDAAVLFADVAGFTSLTEALARRGAEGPEELTLLLNRYFGTMIALLEAEGGEVAEFSGDALTVLFPAGDEPLGQAVRRALQAAEALQTAMVAFAITQTSAGPIALTLKIGIGAGEVATFLVGGTFGRWEYVVAGDPLAQVAAAEHQARPGDVVLSPAAAALLWPGPLPPRPLPGPTLGPVADPDLVASLRGYVPAAVRDWLSAGLHDWAGVLRPMSVLFCGVGGLDYAAPDALARLHSFLQAAQATIYAYEGSINKLAVDDKGTVLLALFGAPPLAHEDDPARALRCALALQATAAAEGLRIAIGVTSGLVFAGPVGGPTRREYTVMGDPVNLAARLMGNAGAGQVRSDLASAEAARAAIACEELPPAMLKGKAAPVRIFRPLGPVAASPGASGALVGRERELAMLGDMLADAQAGASRVLLLRGEAGLGKSRLLAELRRLLAERGLPALAGAGTSVEPESPYRAWREIVVQALGLEREGAPDLILARLGDLATQAPELAERLPLLSAVLPVELPETALTAPLSLAARHELRLTLLIELLRRRGDTPLVVLIEDAQWLDSLSWELALALAQALIAARAPLLLALAMRPLRDEVTPTQVRALAQLPRASRLTLEPLADELAVALAAARLGVAPAALPPEVAALVQGSAEGNPLYAEELALALRDRGLIRVLPGPPPSVALAVAPEQLSQAMPPHIQGIVLARIDRLPPEQQLTLRIGAVIGRRFAYPPLLAAMETTLLTQEETLRSWLLALVQHDLTMPEVAGADLRYLFRHSITRDVAYSSLLFTQRRQLHRAVAEWHERAYGPAPAPYAALLAYHWGQASEPEREIAYLALAGERAASSYALREARQLFGQALERLRALPAPDHAREARLALQLGQVLWYAGELEAARLALVESAAAARAAGTSRALAEALCYLGRVQTEAGDYDLARASLAEARGLAEAAGGPAALLQALNFSGIVAMYAGAMDEATALFDQCLALARQSGDRAAEANILISLGYTTAANIDAAEGHYRASLALSQALDNRWNMAVLLANLGELAARRGDHRAARELAQRSLTIDRAIGNRHGVAVTLNNLGEAACAQGDYPEAARCFREALPLAAGTGNTLTLLYGLQGLAQLQIGLGARAEAAALLALVLAHPARTEDLRAQAQQLLDSLGHPDRPALDDPPARLAAALAVAERWLAALTPSDNQ